MCLSQIYKKYRENNEKTGYGYVVVRKYKNRYGRLCDWLGGEFYKLNIEKECKYKITCDFEGRDYYAGFHILTNKKHAKSYLRFLLNNPEGYNMHRGNPTIVRVKYRNIFCKGTQDYRFSTVVAKYRTIIEEV